MSLIAYPQTRESGFSLIELMISIGITVIILGFAVPGFRAMLINSEIRNAAETIQTGMQQARAEAIKLRNTNVEFVFRPKAARDETSWVVKLPDVGGVPGTVLNQIASREGSPDVTRTEFPLNATTVTFDLTGRPVANLDGSASLTSVHLDVPTSILSAADSKDLTVNIQFTGKIQMCDPNITLNTDPRFCN